VLILDADKLDVKTSERTPQESLFDLVLAMTLPGKS
jgi:hypothetical protein